ncbi:MAG: DUF3341 domain-containing protein [Acidobacteriota bacterium]|nr:DUF3341 domain-containing protein [Acidobacteriota bacterium]
MGDPRTAAAGSGRLVGLLAEYESVDPLLAACRAVRDAGYARWDSMTPFPVHGVDRAMGIRRTILPKLVFVGGLTGALGGLAMQWWMNAVDYPVVISGKPLFSLPAQIPIIFELTILLSALTAFGGMLALNGLPRLYNPLFRSVRFQRVTNDRFYVFVEADDPRFDAERTRKLLEATGCVALEEIRDVEE